MSGDEERIRNTFWKMFRQSRSIPDRDLGDEDVREQQNYNHQLFAHDSPYTNHRGPPRIVYDYINSWWVPDNGVIPVLFRGTFEEMAKYVRDREGAP